MPAPNEPTIEQLGSHYAEILDQPYVWTDAKGASHHLVNMTPQYRANVRNFLRRRVATLRLAVELDQLHSQPPTGDIETDFGVLDDLRFDQTDLEWLYDQPLYKALVALDLE